MIYTDLVYQVGPQCQTPAPYHITPLIAPVGKKTIFRLKIKTGYRQISRWNVTALKGISGDGVLPDGTVTNWEEFPEVPFRIEEDTLVFETVCLKEGPYFFKICCGKREAMGFRIYALEDDLYGMQILKGDTHLHSFYSDGHQDPVLTAMRGRRRGDDFLAVTDHQIYEGSLAAIEALQGTGTGLLLLPGEEMHLPLKKEFIRKYDSAWLQLPWVERALSAHLLNFGGRFSVNDYAYSDLDRYYREVAEYEKQMPPELGPADRFCTAAAEWAFDKVREGGGLAVYPHPFWTPGNRRAVTQAMHDTLMKRGKFDAFETVNSGRDSAFTMPAIAEYSRQLSLGRNYAVVGGADGHDVDHAENWPFTVLLAEELSSRGIIEGIRARRSCSVMPEGKHQPVVTGEFRIVQLVYFLLEYYFPEHDACCALEGSLLEASRQTGDPALAKAVTAAAEQVKVCRASAYGK